jgi:putative serine protease PepD
MRQRILFPLALAGAAVLGAVGGIAGWRATSDDEGARPVASSFAAQATASGKALTLEQLYRRAAPGVVELSVTQESQDGFGFSRETGATGSGFVIDNEGHIVTNYHVVEGASSVTVRFANGDEAQAKVLGSDASTDIAVLELQGNRNVMPLTLGLSESLTIGDAVAAIGSPFGLEGSLTSGIVSGLNRDIRAPDGFTISGAIQTDAALNRGNSGGPLLDEQGRVVGVAAQIQSENGGNIGIGYAVPIDTAKEVVDQILTGREVRHAYLGVVLGESQNGGVVLAQVTTSGPAADSGLRAGDVITSLDGESTESVQEVRAAIETHQPGDKVEVKVLRGGETRTFEVELGDRPARAG